MDDLKEPYDAHVQAARLRSFDAANYICTAQDLSAYREAIIETEIAEIAAWLRVIGASINARGVSGAIHFALADEIKARAYRSNPQ